MSLTCLCSTLLEHTVDSRLRKHLSKHSALHRDQRGFQRGLSCETQLKTTVHEWAKTLGQQGQTDIIFLDFSKAFDSVPQRKLLAKLSHYWIGGNLLRWMDVFLTTRKRFVVNGTESKWSTVLPGVPPGTVLQPLMFLLYINDLPMSSKRFSLLILVSHANPFFRHFYVRTKLAVFRTFTIRFLERSISAFK